MDSWSGRPRPHHQRQHQFALPMLPSAGDENRTGSASWLSYKRPTARMSKKQEKAAQQPGGGPISQLSVELSEERWSQQDGQICRILSSPKVPFRLAQEILWSLFQFPAE